MTDEWKTYRNLYTGAVHRNLYTGADILHCFAIYSSPGYYKMARTPDIGYFPRFSCIQFYEVLSTNLHYPYIDFCDKYTLV